MARVFITGSADGLGAAAARALIDQGHAVVLHLRTPERASAIGDIAEKAVGVVVGDLASAAETQSIAGQVNAETKLHRVALASAPARRWPQALSNAVDPGWVRTCMGGAGAPVYLDTGQRTQSWLAASDDPDAKRSGGYWRNRREEAPTSEALDSKFQAALISRLTGLTGVALPEN